MNKKVLLMPAALVALLGVSLTSCGGGGTGGTSTSTGPISTGPVDISLPSLVEGELSILVPTGNAYETNIINRVFEDVFQLKYPNVTLQIQYVTVTSYETTIANMIVAGNLPDIIWTNTPEYLFLIQRNVAEPLDGYIAASEEAGDFDFDQDFKTSYFDMCSLNGNYYVVPRCADCVVTFVNNELLETAGVDMDLVKNGWTWADFIECCRQYKEWLLDNGDDADDDYYCVDANLTGWGSVSYPMLRSMGGDVLNPDGSIALDSQAALDTVELIRGLTEPGYAVTSGVTSVNSFESGTTPFIFQSAPFSHYDNRAALHGKIDLCTFPLITGEGTPSTPKIGGGVAGYAINKNSPDKVLAWQFLNALISHDGQEAMARGGLNSAPIRTDMNDYTTETWGEGYEHINLQAYLEFDQYKITEEYLGYVGPEYMSDLQLNFSDFIADATQRRKTPEEVVADAVDAIDETLSS